MNKILPVILSGGSGSRLWPLSRRAFSKQFLNLNDGEKSLIQQTALRVSDTKAFMKPLVVCGEDHRFLVADQLSQIEAKPQTIILEPMGRNTAPAVALAALQAQAEGYGEDPMLVLPSDHAIRDVEKFKQTVSKGVELAEKGQLVTFGIVPTHPETGYGYIEKSSEKAGDGFVVKRFVEKPEQKKAEEFIAAGNFYWNAGIFMFQPDAYLKELRRLSPEMYEACRLSMEAKRQDPDYTRPNADEFGKCPDDSIDYAVMEHAKNVAVVPFDGAWNDIGSFKALWEEVEKDENGNAVQGHDDTVLFDTKNCLIHADDMMVTTAGLEDLVIIQTKDALLVASKEHAQDVKKIFEQLKNSKREEVTFHRKVYKPWGNFESLAKGYRFQAKTLEVTPGQQLSLQSHEHRAEHWVVVKGKVKVTRGSDAFTLHRDQSVYLPVGEVHRLANPFDEPALVVEVQTGDYLGEDDIVRYEDVYGRTGDSVEVPRNAHEALRQKKHFIPLDARYKIRQMAVVKPLLRPVRYAKYAIHYAQWLSKGKKGALPYFKKWSMIKDEAKKNDLHTFIETGSHYGETTAAVASAFDRVVTMELADDLYTKVKNRFAGDARVGVLRGDSSVLLPETLQTVNQPALFWLDAHYSGGVTAKGEKETPIKEELEAILSHKVKGHVILIANARCFTGANDYPTQDELRTLVQEAGYDLSVENDVVKIIPASQYSNSN